MNVSSYLLLARRWWWLLTLAALIGGAVAWRASSLVDPTYRASTTLLVMHQVAEGNVDRGDLEASAMLAETLANLITVRPVLETVIEEGGFNLTVAELRDRLTIDHARNSQIIEVSVSADDAAVARDLANSVVNVFIALDPARASFREGTITVVEPAITPTEPTSPRQPVNALLGALLGAVVTTVTLGLREPNDAWRTANDVEEPRLRSRGSLRESGDTGGAGVVLHQPEPAVARSSEGGTERSEGTAAPASARTLSSPRG